MLYSAYSEGIFVICTYLTFNCYIKNNLHLYLVKLVMIISYKHVSFNVYTDKKLKR